MEFVWFIVIGVVVGPVAAWLAGRFMRGNGFGLIGDVIVGVIGACLGAYIVRGPAVELGDLPSSVIVAFVGALLLLFVVRLFTGRRDGRRLWS